MDKKFLRSIPRPAADDKLFKLARHAHRDGMVGLIVQIRDVGKEILQMALFRVSDLCEGKPDAAFRVFLSIQAEGDYITQDLSQATTKWLTGKLDTINSDEFWKVWHPWSWGRDRGKVTMADPESWALLIRAFGKPINKSWWSGVIEWQEKRVERLLEARHRKECEAIDAEMDKVPPLPEDFKEWFREEVLHPFRYLMYEPSKSRQTRAYCTYCGSRMQLDQKKLHPRRDHGGICPACGSPVIFKTAHSQLNNHESRWFCIIQRTCDGFVCRYFYGWAHYDLAKERKDPLVPKQDFGNMEACRVMYAPSAEGSWTKRVYEWGIYKQRGNSRWCPDLDKHKCAMAFLYTRNLPDALAGTPYQYCAVGLLQEKSGYERIPVYHYLLRYPEKPYMEYFVKMGLTNLLSGVMDYGSIPGMNPGGKNLVEIMGLEKPYIRILCQVNGNRSVFELLRQCSADRVLPKTEEILRWHRMLGGDDETMGLVNSHKSEMSLTRFLNWLEKQLRLYQTGSRSGAKLTDLTRTYREITNDWKDYVRWASSLGKDLHDPYYLIPPDLPKAHDQALKEYKGKEKKIQQQAIRKMNAALKLLSEQTDGTDAMHMKAGGLQIVIPKDDSDIRREGEIQHHCVATYIDRVAKGETMILFVRKTENPEKPYFTMEYKDGSVVQCRGFRNCSMPKDVELFVRAFERKMRETEKRSRPRMRIRV